MPKIWATLGKIVELGFYIVSINTELKDVEFSKSSVLH